MTRGCDLVKGEDAALILIELSLASDLIIANSLKIPTFYYRILVHVTNTKNAKTGHGLR